MSSFLSGESLDSKTNLEFTYVNDSLLCWAPFYYAHVTFAYATTIAGILCMITRLHPQLLKYHHWFGKLYVIAMLWATATALLIHNKGLPTGVLYSFLWVLLGLTFGWIAIALHTKRVFKSQALYAGSDRWKRISSEMLTLKAFHGCVMFVSWINVAGRLFVTPVTNDFGCYSYPVFKQVTSKDYTFVPGSPIEYLPVHDPNYSKTPWAYSEQRWAAMLSLGPLFAAFLVGCAIIGLQKQKTSPDTEIVKGIQ